MFCPVCSVYREIFCVCVVVCCDFEKRLHFYVPSFVGGVVLVASLSCIGSYFQKLKFQALHSKALGAQNNSLNLATLLGADSTARSRNNMFIFYYYYTSE